MSRFIFIFWVLVKLSGGLLYVDKVVIETNKTLLTIATQHENRKDIGVSGNVTIQTFLEIQKVLIYMKVNIAANKNDNEYKISLLRTQIDMGKLLKGLYGNAILKGFMDNIVDHFLKQNISFPLRQWVKFFW